jgi:hypothetical protein
VPILETAAHEVFDEKHDKDIVWDDMSLDCDTHVGLLQLVSIGAEDWFHNEMEPISKVDTDDKILYVSGVLHPSEFTMDAVSDVVTKNSENGAFVASVLSNSDAQTDKIPLKSDRDLFDGIPVRNSFVEIHCKDVIWDDDEMPLKDNAAALHEQIMFVTPVASMGLAHERPLADVIWDVEQQPTVEVGAESVLAELVIDFVDKECTEMHIMVAGEEANLVDEQVNNELTAVDWSSPYPELGIIDACQICEEMSHNVVVWDAELLQGIDSQNSLLQLLASGGEYVDG